MRRVTIAVAAAVLVPMSLAAQGGPPRGGFVPDSLRNIQVLPRTMTPAEVVGVMRGVTMALGVRCPFCHASWATWRASLSACRLSM